MDRQLLLLAIPLVLIELGLAVTAVIDWTRRTSYRGLPKWGWLAAILFVGIAGPILYLALGRGEERAESDGRDPK